MTTKHLILLAIALVMTAALVLASVGTPIQQVLGALVGYALGAALVIAWPLWIAKG